MGRKPINANEKRVIGNYTLRPEIKGRIERLAVKYGMSTSRLVEVAIEKMLDSNERFENLLKPKK